MKTLRIMMAVVFGISCSAAASAAEYPDKPVKIIVPFTEGSATDILARVVGQKLSSLWGQPVTFENVAGAGGTVGTDKVAKSAPDGYTLLVHANSYAVGAAIYAKLPYDPRKDLVDIAPFSRQPYALVVGPASGMKSLSDVIKAAKARPGEIKFGSAGVGSGTHLVAEKFNFAAGIKAEHVPYKGGPEANADTASGKVLYWFPPLPLGLKSVRGGQLVAIGVTSGKRMSDLPDVPTIAEAGVPGFGELWTWVGMWAPAGIPAAVKDKLAKDVSRALASPDLREQLIRLGGEPMSMTPDEFSKFVRSEMDAAARILNEAGIKPQ